jgi:hypothetical protein
MLERSFYLDMADESNHLPRRVGFSRQSDPVAKKN